MPRVLMKSTKHLASGPEADSPPAWEPPPESLAASPPPPVPSSSPPTPSSPPPPSPPPPAPSPPPPDRNGPRPPKKPLTPSQLSPVSPLPSPPPTSLLPPPLSPPPSSPPPSTSLLPPSSVASTPPSPKTKSPPSNQAPPEATSPPASSNASSKSRSTTPATPTPTPPSDAGTPALPLETPGTPWTPPAPGTSSSTPQTQPGAPVVMPVSGSPADTWPSPPGGTNGTEASSSLAPPASVLAIDVPIGTVIGVCLAGFLLALASLFLAAYLKYRVEKRWRAPMRRNSVVVQGPVTSPVMSPGGNSYDFSGSKPSFTYDELEGVTGGFAASNVVGEGGFGKVYMGVLRDGLPVAVKQLKVGGGQGEKEFRAEVDIISRIHHRHLVTLVGYCVTENHRLLVYEFVPNKTLEHHLHGRGLPVMDWPKRMKIAIGAARGLTYLHEDCHPRIIHRDIKSANILLDDAFNAKVADFGLAKLSDDAATHVSTRVMGTFGYMAPEYASTGKLTDRSDVFSFGVVLLELITGRKPIDASKPLKEESLARPILVDSLETNDFTELVDPALESRFSNTEMRRMVEAAAACVRHNATKRPRMVQVWRSLDLEGGSTDLTNGVKLGDSTAYESGQYSSDIELFRRMAFAHDLSTAEYGYTVEETPLNISGGR